jgi:hypothetical protein
MSPHGHNHQVLAETASTKRLPRKAALDGKIREVENTVRAVAQLLPNVRRSSPQASLAFVGNYSRR